MSNIQPTANKNWFNNIRESIVTIFSQPVTEITIAPDLDESGSIAWHIYDPKTEKIINFASEQEMLSWLDGNYN